MSRNRYRPHVYVLPEDDANRQVANGFLSGPPIANFSVLPVAGGWNKVLDSFESNEVSDLDRFPNRYMILLIDFDGRYEERLPYAMGRIPDRLRNRVFILGAWSEPEALKTAGLGSYEAIGRKLAKDCRDDTDTTWGHDQLRHNTSEIGRLRQFIRSILFQSA